MWSGRSWKRLLWSCFVMWVCCCLSECVLWYVWVFLILGFWGFVVMKVFFFFCGFFGFGLVLELMWIVLCGLWKCFFCDYDLVFLVCIECCVNIFVFFIFNFVFDWCFGFFVVVIVFMFFIVLIFCYCRYMFRFMFCFFLRNLLLFVFFFGLFFV